MKDGAPRLANGIETSTAHRSKVRLGPLLLAVALALVPGAAALVSTWIT